MKSLSKINKFKLSPSETCYIFLKINDSLNMTSNELKDRLLSKGILIRNCDSFNSCNNYIRISIKSHYENKIFIKKIKEVIHEKETNN